MLASNTSQHLNQKSLIAKQLFSNHVCNALISNPIEYLNNKRGYAKQVALFLLDFSQKDFIQLRYEIIAKAIGCKPITVRKIINEFVSLGLIAKKQHDLFESNYFYINPKLKTYKFKFDNQRILSSRIPDTLLSETYHPIKVNINLFISLKSSTSTSTCTLPFESEIVKKRHVLKLEKEKMLSREKKNWILSKKHDPKIKEAFENPEIKKLLFPYVIEELTKLLGLGNLERYKLTAYDEQVLQITRDHCIAELTNTRSKLKNKFGWFLKQCDKLNEAKNLKPDWPWFYAVCEILDINLNSYNFTQKSEKPKSSSLSEQVKSSSQLFNESKIEESKKASQIIGQKEILLEKYNGYIKHNQGMYKQTGNKCYLESIKRWEDNIKYLETYGIRSEEEEKVRMEEAINNFLKVFPFDPRQTA